VRGKGMLLGLELVLDQRTGQTTQPPGDIGKAFRLACRERGLILLSIHPGNVMLIAPPLNMSRAEMDEMIDIIDRALTDIDQQYGLN
jgi:4-aminobutyrate aminotransferase-like enzyme